jgi:hypothetical protein
VFLDLSRREALGVQRDDRLVESLDPTRVFRHDLRLELPVTVTRHINPHRSHIGVHRFLRPTIPLISRGPPGRIAFPVAPVLIQFGVQRRLQHRFRDLRQQSTRPGQGHALRPSLLDQLPDPYTIHHRRIRHRRA